MVVVNEKANHISEIVSIIIPVFNREDFLYNTLFSIKNQTYDSWEAIIVDDGSTDKSLDIIQAYVKRDNRFKFFARHRQPKGAQTCRNIGMENASGKNIIFLDSDDILAPYCLLNRVNFMEQNPDLDFSINHVITFEKVPGDINILWNILDDGDDILRFFSDDVPWQTSSPIWKKEFVDQIKWDESCISGQDWDFHVQALSLKPKYKKLANAIPDCFIRRDHDVERISRNFYKAAQILNREVIWKKNYKILKAKNMWKEEYNLPFASFYFRFCEYFLIKLKNNQFNAWQFYKNVYQENLLKPKTFLWTAFYLMGLYLLRNREYFTKIFYKKLASLMPESLVSENFYSTQEKVKLEGTKLEQFVKALKSHNYSSFEENKG
ncbi:MAG: glycosyltransferase family 2 protein [Bacteroidota bacterium]|nr:glycosyltransferase family 2 protein [Bacteroidota bacterium]